MGVDRGYLMRGSCPGGAEPVGKPVVASEGDVVDVTDAETRVNGKPLPHSFRHRIDSRGRDLPSVPEGTYVLRPGELWIASDEHPKSWDSRYYGPVHEAHVRGVLELSLLWEWPFFPWLTESD
jgi:conjugative transfer signal peptidase TraF